MRILQVMAGAEHGGAEAFFYRLVPALSKAGLSQHVILRPHKKALALFKQHQIPVTTAPFRRSFDFKTPRLIHQTAKSFQPGIVMTWMSRASHLCPKGPYLSVARLGGYYDLKYYQKADVLIGNTKDIQNYFLKEGWPADKTAYLPNFVDPPTSCSPLSKATFKTPESAPVILALGRLHDDKAFDVLIKALTQTPDAFLWIGGTGPREDFLKTLARNQGVSDRVRFLGWQEDISPFYKACDIYCCPSRIEPLGNVVIEGWAHQKPVVAARSAGPEGLISHGNDGLLAPVEDYRTLAHHLNTLLNSESLRNQIAQRGYQTFKENFTEERIIAQYKIFFKTLLSQQNGVKACVE